MRQTHGVGAGSRNHRNRSVSNLPRMPHHFAATGKAAAEPKGATRASLTGQPAQPWPRRLKGIPVDGERGRELNETSAPPRGSEFSVTPATRGHSSYLCSCIRILQDQLSKAMSNPANLFIPPMEAEPTRHIPDGDDWQHGPKFDGYRAIVVRHSGETYLFSRRGHIFNQRFQRLTRALQKLPGKSFTLDGEVVAFNAEGRISFELVRQPCEHTFPLHFVAFDLLRFDGADLMKLPLHERRRRLESAFTSWPEVPGSS